VRSGERAERESGEREGEKEGGEGEVRGSLFCGGVKEGLGRGAWTRGLEAGGVHRTCSARCTAAAATLDMRSYATREKSCWATSSSNVA